MSFRRGRATMSLRFSTGRLRVRGEQFPEPPAGGRMTSLRSFRMMRMKLMALASAAVLALPLTAGAWGNKSGCDSGGGPGGSLLPGLFAGLQTARPAPSNKLGHGFFQPPFQAAPWYLYWPYDAHFQLPAPIGAAYQP